jgi:EpsD family peptidyl-prolyl cis-trans isomerase
MQNTSYRLSITLLVISIALTACGLGEKKDASQVAAKVNGTEITVHQLNQALSNTPGITAENVDKARKEILERLIVQELAVAKATDAKLDRTPDVVMAMDAARRDILARAYFSQVGGGVTNVEKAEVMRYFEDHPELFTHRKIYSISDIALQKDSKLLATLQGMVADNKSMQDIANWLKGNGTKFEANNYTSAAEQLSLELLPKIASLSDGQSAVIEAGQAMHVINVIKSKEAPVDFATAAPQIKQYLGSENSKKLVSDEIKKLRDSAKVEYLGDFGPDKAKDAMTPVPVVEAKPSDAAQTKAAEAESIAKGAAGLK